jgi:hypothetical protein
MQIEFADSNKAAGVKKAALRHFVYNGTGARRGTSEKSR